MKRLFDIVASFLGLIVFSPILLPVIFAVWYQDGHSPFYVSYRVGKGEKLFRMIKLRSMIANADATGVDSTGSNDQRITQIGHFIRNYKLDEIAQLWNVFRGDMSLVGPRPNVKRETDLYTPLEKRILNLRPGITDFASIVFSDEGEILKDKIDPDIAYNQLIRPGKSYLAIFYIEHRTFLLDIQLCFITLVTLFSREKSLRYVATLLKKLGASPELISIANRKTPLQPMPPPGAIEIVTAR